MMRNLISRVTQDLEANLAVTESDWPETKRVMAIVRTCLTARFVSVFLFRLSQLVGERTGFAGSLVKQFNQFATGADLAWQATVGSGLVLPHPVGVVVGPYCTVGSGCLLQQGVTLGGNGNPGEGAQSSPTLEDAVIVGAGAKVLGSLTVGVESRIGANAVVTRSIPPRTFAVGVPAVPKNTEYKDSVSPPATDDRP